MDRYLMQISGEWSSQHGVPDNSILLSRWSSGMKASARCLSEERGDIAMPTLKTVNLGGLKRAYNSPLANYALH